MPPSGDEWSAYRHDFQAWLLRNGVKFNHIADGQQLYTIDFNQLAAAMERVCADLADMYY